MARVSVVIALYNKVRYIESCIDSVLQQSMQDWQLIIVDDGSTDGSDEKALAFTKDERITLIRQVNAGPGKARNNGLAQVKTPYVTFLDADDRWEKDCLLCACTALENNPTCDLWLCAASWKPLGQLREPILSKEKNKYANGPWTLDTNYTAEETYDVLNFFATGAVVSKTEVVRRYGGYFDRIKCTSGEDGYLWLQVMYNHVIYRDQQPFLVVNTEGSDLGIGRPTLKPVPPWLLYPQPILAHCPSEYKTALTAYFNLTAFMAFRREAYQGHAIHALKLWYRFPRLSSYRNNDYPPLAWALCWYPFKHYLRKLRRP